MTVKTRFAGRTQKMEEVRSSGVFYKGEVFIDRDLETDKIRRVTQPSEKQLVRQLYRLAHEKQGGLLRLGQEDYWLITWEVPNQGSEQSNKTKGRRADLLGIDQQGNLVVLECKAEANERNTPLYALLEGLDYLGCLLTDRNLKKLTEGFRKWRDKDRTSPGEKFMSRVPPAFRETEIRAHGRHKVVMLAPAKYFQSHERDSRGLPQDWWFLSDRFWNVRPVEEGASSVGLDFATMEFSDPTCELLNLPWLERVEPDRLDNNSGVTNVCPR